MKFSEALQICQKENQKITRPGWNGKQQYVCVATMKRCVLSDGTIIEDPKHVNIGSQFLMFVGTSGYQCGWLASQSDLLADDWEVYHGI